MSTKTPTTVVLFLLFVQLIPGHADEHDESGSGDRYATFTDDVHDYEKFSNGEISTLVFDGIYSGDDETVKKVLLALYWEAHYMYLNKDRRRDLSLVPGLRDFLNTTT